MVIQTWTFTLCIWFYIIGVLIYHFIKDCILDIKLANLTFCTVKAVIFFGMAFPLNILNVIFIFSPLFQIKVRNICDIIVSKYQ